MDETWVNTSKEGHPTLVNHLWTCKFCGPAFTSTDKQCHGNTTALNKHMHQAHEMNSQKHKLGIQPTLKGSVLRAGAMDQFVTHVEPIPSAEEAVLQFFALTNQSFEIIQHKSFQNLYRSVDTTYSISSTDILY